MLTPEQYDLIADSMGGIFEDLEEFVIRDFVRRVVGAGTITETARYQLLIAEQMGLSTIAIRNAVQEALALSDAQIEELFTEWGLEGVRMEAGIMKQAGIDTKGMQELEEFQRIMQAAIAQTQGEIKNLTNSMGFAQVVNGKVEFIDIAAYYQKELDSIQMQIQTGVLDYNSAIRQAIKRMADSGLRTIDYKTGWSNQLETAVRRATLTGANQMSGQMTDELGKEMNCNFVEVTAHAGARDTGEGIENHKSWQGKVYSRVGATPEYPNLYEKTGLGRGPGLKGWNCRHDYNNFFPGYSKRAWTDEELENIDPPPFEYKGRTYTYYQATQRQRDIERAIRRSKRELIGYDEAGDTDAFTTASVRLRRQKEEYASFSRAAKLKQRPELQQVYGYGKGIAQKAVHAGKIKVKTKTNGGNGGIIKNKKESVENAVKGLPKSAKTPEERKAFAESYLDNIGVDRSNVKVAIKNTKSEFGYCAISKRDNNTCHYGEYVLKKADQRGEAYQKRTAFHEAYHLALNGQPWDALDGKSFNKKWLMMEETFAEASAHYVAGEYGIKEALAPSYSEKLIKTLPRLKMLEKYKDCQSIKDFGKIALEDRLSGVGGIWSDLYDKIFSLPFDENKYYQKYFDVIRKNYNDLFDKMFENTPENAQYRNYMKDDLFNSINKIKKGWSFEKLSDNEKVVFSNIMINAMERKGI